MGFKVRATTIRTKIESIKTKQNPKTTCSKGKQKMGREWGEKMIKIM